MVNAGFNPLEEIARKTGKSIGELKEEMSKGAISSKMVQDAFISATSAGGKFFGMSQEGAKTLNGQISMLQESFDMMFNEIGQKGEGIIMGTVKAGTYLVEHYEQVGKILEGVVVAYGSYKAALLFNIALEKIQALSRLAHARNIGILSAATGVLKGKVQALNITMLKNPYAIVFAALVTIGYEMYRLSKQSDTASAAQKRLKDANNEVEKSTQLEISKLNGLRAELEQSKKGTDKWKSAKDAIISQYGQYDSKLAAEIDRTGTLTSSYNNLTTAIRKSVAARQLKQFYDSNMQETQDDIQSRRNEIYKGLKKQYSQQTSNLLMKYVNQYISTGKGLDQKITYKGKPTTVRNMINNVHGSLFGFGGGSNAREARELQVNSDKAVKDYIAMNNISDAEANETLYGIKPTEKKKIATIKSKKYWEDKKKEAQSKLDALSDIAAKGKQGDVLRKEIDGYNKKLDAFSVGSRSGGNHSGGRGHSGVASEIQEKKIVTPWGQSDEVAELAAKGIQSYIDAMQEGYEKEKKQRDFNHVQELADLDKYKHDYLNKKRDNAKEKFEADPKNKGKKFNAASVTLTKDEQDKFDKMRSDTLKKHVNEDKEAEDERIRNARAAWQAYYHNFGTYAEKRKALQEELNDKLAEIDRKSITESQKQAEKATLTKQYANQFDELDNSVKNSTTLMGQLFADASKKSISEIEDVIDKTQLLLSYLEAVKDENGNATINGKNVSRKDLLGLGISENALSNLEQDPTKIESIRSALDRLKGELGAKSPFELLKKEIKAAGKELNKGGKQNIANGIMAIADAVHSFLPCVKEFGNSLGTIFGDDLGDKIGSATDALDGLVATGKGVGQIISGDIVGGTMSAINGISQVINALDGMFGADYSHYNEMVERYNTLNSIWDSLIDKKLKYINTSYGMEAQMVADEAIKLAYKSQESYRILGKERLNSGASVGSHSIGIRQRKKISSEGWSELRNVTREIGLNYNNIAGGRMTGLFDLTAEQLSKLKEGAQTFWAQLDNDVRKYLDGIIDGDERIQEIQRKQKEQFTQISFDSLFDGFVDKLMDMKTSWADFSKDASTIFMKAVLTNQIGIQFQKKLQDWYDKFAKSTEGGMTEDERKSLTDEYKGYVDEAIKMRDELAKTVGYDVASAEQSASANGVSSITYEQASNIVALTTAGNISRDQIKDVLLSQKLSSIDLSLTGISLIGKDTVSIADETRTILANSYMELKEINENTGVSAKCLTQIDENINSMNRLIKEKL